MYLCFFRRKKLDNRVLGDFYMNWNVSNKYRGQYFTPFHIAELMANITGEKRGMIYDPTCGSGVMLIASAKNMKIENIWQSIFIGQDVDLICVKMCALNLCFYNLDGYAIWGNTLAGECDRVYETKRTYLGGDIRELKGEELEKFKNKMYPKIKEKQLSLL
jgi:type I restriction-modification system DNA methylase subunit